MINRASNATPMQVSVLKDVWTTRLESESLVRVRFSNISVNSGDSLHFTDYCGLIWRRMMLFFMRFLEWGTSALTPLCRIQIRLPRRPEMFGLSKSNTAIMTLGSMDNTPSGIRSWMIQEKQKLDAGKDLMT